MGELQVRSKSVQIAVVVYDLVMVKKLWEVELLVESLVPQVASTMRSSLLLAKTL